MLDGLRRLACLAHYARHFAPALENLRIDFARSSGVSPAATVTGTILSIRFMLQRPAPA